jgi:hypothetical protein
MVYSRTIERRDKGDNTMNSREFFQTVGLGSLLMAKHDSEFSGRGRTIEMAVGDVFTLVGVEEGPRDADSKIPGFHAVLLTSEGNVVTGWVAADRGLMPALFEPVSAATYVPRAAVSFLYVSRA